MNSPNHALKHVSPKQNDAANRPHGVFCNPSPPRSENNRNNTDNLVILNSLVNRLVTNSTQTRHLYITPGHVLPILKTTHEILRRFARALLPSAGLIFPSKVAFRDKLGVILPCPRNGVLGDRRVYLPTCELATVHVAGPHYECHLHCPDPPLCSVDLVDVITSTPTLRSHALRRLLND